MNKVKSLILFLLTSSALLFSSCVLDNETNSIADVELQAESTSISYNGSTTLTATVSVIGNADITYSWEITSGSDYAIISGDGATATLIGTNLTTSSQNVKVKVTASDGSISYSDKVTVTVGEIVSEISAVYIAGSSSIAATGTGTLTAIVTYTGAPTITYAWQITDGAIKLSSDNEKSITITGQNNSYSDVKVTVRLTVSDGTNSFTTSHDVLIAAAGTSVTDEITGVSISTSSASITSTGTTTLLATPTYTGSPTISYTWEITDGSDYASLNSTTEQLLTLTGTNTTTSAQSVTVQVTASDGTNAKTATTTVTVGASSSTSTSTTETTADGDDSSSTTDTSSSSGSSSVNTEITTNILYINVNTAKVSADNSTWYSITTSKTKFNDKTLSVKFTEDDDGNSTGLIKVDAEDYESALTVNITGTNSTSTVGGIKIQSNGTGTVNVILNGVTLTSTNYPCIAVTNGSATAVTLTGTNTLVDGRSYGTGYGEEYSTTSGTYTDDDGNSASYTVVKAAVQEGSDSKGTLFSKGDMTISGSGSLTVTESYKNCIATKGVLTVDGGTFTLISTGKAGLYGEQGVNVNDGSVTFTGTGEVSSSANHKAHGINTDDDTYTSSYVNVTGGTLNFNITYGKGITAPVVNVSGGTNTIKITSPTTKITDTSATYYDADGVSTTETVSLAPQGIDGGTVTISGGTTTITAPWTGVNSDGDITISDGTLTITTSASAVYDSSDSDYVAPACIKANGDMVVSGGTVTGTSSGDYAKGIKVDGIYTQTDGTVDVEATGATNTSSDDNEGADKSGFGGGSSGDMKGPGGNSRSASTTSSSSSASEPKAKGMRVAGAITISGGKLYVTSTYDEGIESKDTITITGGEVYGYSTGDDAINSSGDMTISDGYVCGYSNANDGLDANGNMYIQGGVVFAVCTSEPEVALDANTEEQKCLYITGGTIITLGPLESGASLSQNCYQASWSANTTYGVTVGSTTYVFTTPNTTSGYGSGMVVSGASTPTVTSGASTSGGTSYFDGKLYEGGTKGNTTVSLSSYTASSK